MSGSAARLTAAVAGSFVDGQGFGAHQESGQLALAFRPQSSASRQLALARLAFTENTGDGEATSEKQPESSPEGPVETERQKRINRASEGPVELIKDVKREESMKAPNEWFAAAEAHVLQSLHRAQEVAAEAEIASARLKDMQILRGIAALRQSVVTLPDMNGMKASKLLEKHRAGLERAVDKMSTDGSGDGESRTELSRLQNDAASLRSALDRVVSGLSVALHRALELVTLAKPVSTAISNEDILDPPTTPGEDPPPELSGEAEPLKTAAGCKCLPSSTCSARGRNFKWCVVDDTDLCPLKADLTMRDAASSDHRVAGSLPMTFWDYCVPRVEAPPSLSPPKDGGVGEGAVADGGANGTAEGAGGNGAPSGPSNWSAMAVHEGCQCTDRQDLVDLYLSDPIYRSKDGKILWNLIPWSDRLALEVLEQHRLSREAGVEPPSLCMRVADSGHHAVCPTAQPDANGDQSRGWCSAKSWDVCTPQQFLPVKEVEESKDAGPKEEPAEAKPVPPPEEEKKEAEPAPKEEEKKVKVEKKSVFSFTEVSSSGGRQAAAAATWGVMGGQAPCAWRARSRMRTFSSFV